MSEEKTIEERQSEMKLKLADTLMKTIPPVPENFHTLKSDDQDKIMNQIEKATAQIMQLLGAKTTRGPARNPRGPRRSERFNTPELDIGIAKKKKAE